MKVFIVAPIPSLIAREKKESETMILFCFSFLFLATSLLFFCFFFV